MLGIQDTAVAQLYSCLAVLCSVKITISYMYVLIYLLLYACYVLVLVIYLYTCYVLIIMTYQYLSSINFTFKPGTGLFGSHYVSVLVYVCVCVCLPRVY